MKKFSRWSIRGFSVLLFGLVAAQFQGGTAFAATKTWTGTAGDHKFSTSGNWSPSGAPTNGDGLVFPNAIADDTDISNDLNNLSVSGVTFSGSTDQKSYRLTGNSLTLSTGVTSTVSATYFSAIFDMPVTLAGAQSFILPSGSSLNFYDNLTGSGAITKTGSGSLGLYGDNSAYSGAITVSEGNLGAFSYDSATDFKQLGANSAGTVIASGAQLSLCYTNDKTLAEPLTLGGGGTNTNGAVTVGACGGPGDFSKVVDVTGPVTLTDDTIVGGSAKNRLKVSGSLSGNYTISLLDGITASLEIASSANTSKTPNGIYTSKAKVVTIPAGDNQPNTSVSIPSAQTYIINGIRGDVDASGVLKGNGKVGNVVIYPGGTIAPGNSPGCLTTANLELNSGTYEFEANGSAACTNYDQIIVNGTVTLAGSDNVLSATLLEGYVPKAGNVFVLINNDGTDAVNGTFKNLSEGATFELNGVLFRISYVGGDGNDVTLSVVSVPAVPNTGAALVTGNPVLLAGLGLASTATLLVVGRKHIFKRK